jgi:hypothetical protein
MKHCINNNYSFAGFWRLWHATLNKWIIRYMCANTISTAYPTASLYPLYTPSIQLAPASRYAPLGGKRAQIWSMWIIFTFVGLWHDLWCARPARTHSRPPCSHTLALRRERHNAAGGAGSRGPGSTACASPSKLCLDSGFSLKTRKRMVVAKPLDCGSPFAATGTTGLWQH